MTWRHEHKHWITVSDALALRGRLSCLMQHDSHADDNGEYQIRSMYFDNFDACILQEKVNGLLHREKFRIRLYNHDPTTLRLERKIRHNGMGRKESAAVSAEQCRHLLAGDVSFILPDSPALLQALKAEMQVRLLRCATVVDYTREAFVSQAGNVRITLDREIRTGVQGTDFLNPDLPTVPTTFGDALVLEVKYDAFLPEAIRCCLQLEDRNATSVSKYAMCRVWG